MLFVLLCEKFSMSYNELMKQPAWFIEACIIKIQVDLKQQEMAARKHKRYGK